MDTIVNKLSIWLVRLVVFLMYKLNRRYSFIKQRDYICTIEDVSVLKIGSNSAVGFEMTLTANTQFESDTATISIILLHHEFGFQICVGSEKLHDNRLFHYKRYDAF